MNLSGIYKIQNKVNGKLYIGSAVNLPKRFYHHQNRLLAGRHANKHLQKAWDKYGQTAFRFVVVEKVERTYDLIRREQYWINKFQSYTKGYNLCPTAGSSLGIKRSLEHRRKTGIASLGRKHTTKTKQIIRDAALGRRHSLESKKKISDSKLGDKNPAKRLDVKAKIKH